MIIRYVFGRPVPPKHPTVLKNGKISHNKTADTTAALYRKACEDNDQPINEEYLDLLVANDTEKWAWKYDMFGASDTLSAALYDAQMYQRAIATSSPLPPKNAFACDMCGWRTYCEADPMATNVENWDAVKQGKPPATIKIKYGRNMKTIKRDRKGFVVSPSELRNFAKCNRQWLLESHWRIQRIYEGTKSLPRVRGSLTHQCLDDLGKAKMDNSDSPDLLTTLRLKVHDMLSKKDIDEEAFAALIEPDSLQAIADTAIRMFALAMDGVEEVIEHEQRRILKMPGSKKWLHGIPDAVVRLSNGQIAVVEYKTTSSTKNLPGLADRYRTNPAPHLYAALVQYGSKSF